MDSRMGNGSDEPPPPPQNPAADDSNTSAAAEADIAVATVPTMAAAATTNNIAIVRDLGANDVVMGRGAFSIRNEGNIRMGQIVASRRMEYRSTSNRRTKDTIARQVVQQVRNNTGRFLRRIESEGEMHSLGIQSDETAFVLADEDAGLLKAKQSLRDKEGSKGSQPLNDSSAMDDQLSREQGETDQTPTRDGGTQPKRARMAEASDAGIAAAAATRTDTALVAAALSAGTATGTASAVAQASEDPVGQLLASLVMRGAPPGQAASSGLHPLALLRQQREQEQIHQVQLALLQQEQMQRQREQDQLAALRRLDDMRTLGIGNPGMGGGSGELNLALTLATLESQQQPSDDARSILTAAQRNPQLLQQLLHQRRSADAMQSDRSQAAATAASATTTTSPPALHRQTSRDSNFPYPMSYAATTARRQALERETLEQQQRQQVFDLQERLLSSLPQQRLGEAALSAATLAAALREQSNLPNTNQTLLDRALQQQQLQQRDGGGHIGRMEDSFRDDFLLQEALGRNSVGLASPPLSQQPTAASLLAALQRQDEEQRRLWNHASRYGNSLHAAPAASVDGYGDAAALLRSPHSQLALGSFTAATASSSLMPGAAMVNPIATSTRMATTATTTTGAAPEPSVARAAEEESKAEAAVPIPTPAARKRDCK